MQCTNLDNYDSNGNFATNIPPCGKCLSCKATQRYEWASRLLLERKTHQEATFFTLTFSEEHLPGSHQELKPLFQKFIKRLNKNEGKQPRYFTCMEFGSLHGRPHFHGIFFGRKVNYVSRRTPAGIKYSTDPVIEDTWQNGSTYSKDCSNSGQGMNIMRYVTNYVLKNKWQNSDSSQKEWALMSRTPYLGQPALRYLSVALATRQGARHCAILGTIPNKFKMAGKIWKIPLRMRRELGEHFGYPVKPIPHSDGTIILLNGMEVRNEKAPKIYTLEQARVLDLKLSRKIKSLRNTNTTPETG